VAVASAGPYANLHLAADRQPRQHPTTQLPPAIAIENINSQCFVIMVKDGDCEQSSDVATSKQQEGMRVFLEIPAFSSNTMSDMPLYGKLARSVQP